jgi:hypothetical protein
MPTKPTKYHTGDLVRVNFKYNWSIPQLVQLKQQRSIVLVLDGPRTEESVVQYQIKLQDVIWVPRAALLRRANEKERQAYANAVGDCEHHNKTDRTKELDLKFKDLDTPAIDADSSGSFSDTLKQLFQGIPDVPVEQLKQDDKDTEKTCLHPLLGAVIDKTSAAGNMLSALLHGLFADMPSAASGDSSADECTFTLSPAAEQELGDAFTHAAKIAGKHGVPFFAFATISQKRASDTSDCWKVENMMSMRNMCKSRCARMHQAVQMLLSDDIE